MAEYIKFKKIVIYGMIIKMCCNCSAVHVICRLLNRSKCIYLLTVRQYYYSPRMLPRSSFYAYTAQRKSPYLSLVFSFTMFRKVIFNIAECSLSGKCSYSSCSKCKSLAEKLLCIFMSMRLIFSRKIQVYIRLLIPLKT